MSTLPPTPFHVLTPLLKQAQLEGWTHAIRHEVDKRLPKIGNWSLVETLMAKGYSPTPMFIIQSAAVGNLDFLLRGRQCNLCYVPKALQAALENGQVESVRFLFKYYPSLKSHYNEDELLAYCIRRTWKEDGWIRSQHIGQINTFRFLVENGYRIYVSDYVISTATIGEIMRAEHTHNYSFSILSYLYQETIIDDQKVLSILEDFKTAKRTCDTIDFRKLFEVRPDFKKVCWNNDLSEYPYLQEKVNKVKEAIDREKEESTVLQTNFPGDVLRYVVWNYL